MPASEQVTPENEKQALQFIINQFKNSEHQQLKALFDQATELERIREHQVCIEKAVTRDRWQNASIEILNIKRDKILKALRKKLNRILEQEEEEQQKRKAVRPRTEIGDAAHQALCLLTQCWPGNLPSERLGLPACPLCSGAIDSEENRMVTSYPCQFHSTCLAVQMRQSPNLNPITKSSFNARDCQLILKKKPLNFLQEDTDLTEDQSAFPCSFFYFMFGCLGLLLVAAGLQGMVSVAVLMALTFPPVIGLLVGIPYIMYQGCKNIAGTTMIQQDCSKEAVSARALSHFRYRRQIPRHS